MTPRLALSRRLSALAMRARHPENAETLGTAAAHLARCRRKDKQVQAAGGRARAKALPPEQRKAIAQKAGLVKQANWRARKAGNPP